MYPNSSYSNRDASLSSINHPNSSFCNYDHENLSNPTQDHYIPLGDELELFQEQHQRDFSSDHNVLHSTMEKSSNNNGTFATDTGGDHFINSRLILGNTGKRASKKDRHSKINTAKGPRDRRMRLSLDVAKKFFRLQDMLGFDKASNTIEWLLMKSKPAIQDLVPNQLNQICSLIGLSNSASSTSECEVMSGIVDQSMEKTGGAKMSNKEKKGPERGVRKSAYMHHSLAKETREEARARARKRTAEKRNKVCSCGDDDGVSCCDQNSKFRAHLMDQNVNRLGSWIPFRENQVQTSDHTCSQIQYKQQGILGDHSSAMPTSWSPSFLFYNNAGPSHEHHQFNDYPVHGKSWEGYGGN